MERGFRLLIKFSLGCLNLRTPEQRSLVQIRNSSRNVLYYMEDAFEEPGCVWIYHSVLWFLSHHGVGKLRDQINKNYW